MSTGPTKDLNGNKSFEERVFARFDALDDYLRDMDSRVQMLESKAYDTKPIWERALRGNHRHSPSTHRSTGPH